MAAKPSSSGGHRHRDRAGERALASTASLRTYNDSYSAFVSAMKFALPILAFTGVGVVLLLPQLESTEKAIRTSIKEQIRAQDLENLYMVKARFVGTDEKSRSYQLTADSARQVSSDSELVALEGPKARIKTPEGDRIGMRANAGAFYRKKQRLVLFGNVNITHDDGYTIRTKEMEIDMKGSAARGDAPITVQGPQVNLRAKGFEVRDKGETVLFKGKARMTIYVENDKLNFTALPNIGDAPALPGSKPKTNPAAGSSAAKPKGKPAQ